MEGQGHNFTANEIDALTSLAFSLGKEKMNASVSKNLTDKIISGNYTKQQMYDEFLTYDASHASEFSGLPKRHAAEAKIFLMGFYDIGFYDRELDPCIE